ncbi:hypothetical protein [Novosphingobium lentum]|uniref:hypothetical protein n=1 Tax=Novosphingobium lentum TaxID=145287 RepID=UPI000ABE0C9E|nr:hypothetical protein [Novosphingobium lentum]
MFGPRITTIFASRWKALWWAAGMIVTTISLVPSADDKDAAGNAPGSPPTGHHNPWSKN